MRRKVVGAVFAMLLVVALTGCETPWRSGRFDSRSTGFNPVEKVITRDNVGSLALLATADVPEHVEPWSQPIVAGGSVYLAGLDGLVVYSADASVGCTGEPMVCVPRWLAPDDDHLTHSVPTIADGKVFVAARDPNMMGTSGSIRVFDAAGEIGCTGTPRVCEPLWTAPVGGVTSLLVSDHRVFVVERRNRIAVLDADGMANCSGTPKVCEPLWTTSPISTGGTFYQPNAPTAAAGVVVVMDNFGALHAYDAQGATNCSGSPLVCGPLWNAPGYRWTGLDYPTNLTWTAPVIVGDQVIGYRSGPYGTTLVAAFDLQGAEGCSGAPKVCAPLWSTLVTGDAVDAEVTAAHGSVFVLTEGSVANHGSRLTAIADDGAGCAGVPMMCPVQWQHEIPSGSPTATRQAAPIVANGLLYVPTYAGLRVFNAHPLSPARDWTASPGECTGVSGAPLTCQPVATIEGPAVERNAVISDGRLYAVETTLSSTGWPVSSQLKIYVPPA